MLLTLAPARLHIGRHLWHSTGTNVPTPAANPRPEWGAGPGRRPHPSATLDVGTGGGTALPWHQGGLVPRLLHAAAAARQSASSRRQVLPMGVQLCWGVRPHGGLVPLPSRCVNVARSGASRPASKGETEGHAGCAELAWTTFSASCAAPKRLQTLPKLAVPWHAGWDGDDCTRRRRVRRVAAGRRCTGRTGGRCLPSCLQLPEAADAQRV